MLEQAVKKHGRALPALLHEDQFHKLEGTDQEKLEALRAVVRNTWLVPRARLTMDDVLVLTRK